MNQSNIISAFGISGTANPPQSAVDALQTRFALRVAATLTEKSRDVGADVNERLRFAREKALERAREVRREQAPVVVGKSGTGAGAALLGRVGTGWWLKLASVVPAVALIAGLMMIQRWQDNAQIDVAAEVDAALLSDDLPPSAYSDAGFAEFLKTPGE